MDKSKIKFGIIGFGIFGVKRLIPGFANSKNTELIAISKRSQSEAEQQAKKYSIPFAYDSAEKLVKNDEIDAIFSATPNSIHLSDVITAAEAGKHIIVEKPMGINSQQCEEMIRVCEKNGVKLMVAHCMRYNTTIQAIKKKIEDGVLGKIVSVNCNFYYNSSMSKRDWIYDPKVAGAGPILDLGVHCLDNIRYLSGKEVTGIKVFKHHNLKRDVESSANIILNLEDDVMGSIQCAYEGDYYTKIDVKGVNASIHAEHFNLINTGVKLRTFSFENNSEEIIHNGNCYTAEIDDFANCLLKNTPVPIPGSEGLKNQQILDKIL
jgi:predicted dehydrogenase